jgi:uncharacterized protein
MRALIVGMHVLFASSLASTSFAADVPDTHANRLAAARSYLEVASIKSMMRDTIIESAKSLPENVRSSYVQWMTKSVRVEVLESTALASMAQHFTLKELKALAAFYGSPEGRSAVKKFGAYMADVMPVIQQEMLRAQQQLESQSQQNR